MWYTIVTVLHVIVCFFLATVVLLQQGKGSDVSAVFGGSSQTLFGSSGAGNLLTKLTSASAIIFMITSLTLTYGAARQSTKSLFDSAPATVPAPVAPEDASKIPLETTTESPSAAAPSTPATTAPQAGAATEGQQATTTPNVSSPTTPSPPAAAPAPQESNPAPASTPATK